MASLGIPKFIGWPTPKPNHFQGQQTTPFSDTVTINPSEAASVGSLDSYLSRVEQDCTKKKTEVLHYSNINPQAARTAKNKHPDNQYTNSSKASSDDQETQQKEHSLQPSTDNSSDNIENEGCSKYPVSPGETHTNKRKYKIPTLSEVLWKTHEGSVIEAASQQNHFTNDHSSSLLGFSISKAPSTDKYIETTVVTIEEGDRRKLKDILRHLWCHLEGNIITGLPRGYQPTGFGYKLDQHSCTRPNSYSIKRAPGSIEGGNLDSFTHPPEVTVQVSYSLSPPPSSQVSRQERETF